MLVSDQPDFQAQMTEIMDEKNSVAAMRLAKVLMGDMSSGQVTGSRVGEKQMLLAQLTALAFPFLSVQMAEEVFELYPVFVASGLDAPTLIDKFKERLLDEPAVEDKNAFREKIRMAILRSPQQLGQGPLMLGSAEVAPTISNWMKLYTAEVGNDRATTIKLARFFSQNKYVVSLSPEERQTLRNIVDFYEYLKKKSESLDGFDGIMYLEDEEGKLKIISDGKVEDMFDKQTLERFKQQARERTLPPAILWELMLKFPEEFKEFESKDYVAKPAGPMDASAVAQQVATFMADQKSRFSHRVLASGVPLPNRTAALVAMLHKAMARGQEADMILAKEILQFVLADQDRFVNFMRHSSVLTLLQTELPKSIGEKNKDVVRQSPTSPMALQALLQIVFSQRFKLSDEEAAWQSFDVIQRLPMDLKDLKTVVTYDPVRNKLVWRY